MSWATHDIEPYVIKRELGLKVAFIPLLLGSYAPDILTKWLVYGDNIFGFEIRADNPAQFHRGWPGFGFTHSLMFGVLCALIIYLPTKSKIWAISFMIGQWAHAISDVGDTMGTMLLFPFSTHLFSLNAWAYAGQTGRITDAAAYFSGLGFVWDGFWIICGLLCWRGLTMSFFQKEVVPVDPFWAWARRKRISDTTLVIIYRGFFWYGITRWIAWLLWAHVIHHYPFDLSWGGPYWVHAEGR
jgi:membrane-bound metal-dependent hydrolase YbcI (DUF457 family)